MAQTLSNFDEALKIDYLPVIREQLENASYLLTKVRRNERDVQGKRWQNVAHYKRNSGIGARADGGTLPTAGQQAYLNPYGTVAYNYGRIQVSGKLNKVGPAHWVTDGNNYFSEIGKSPVLCRTIASQPLLVGV